MSIYYCELGKFLSTAGYVVEHTNYEGVMVYSLLKGKGIMYG